MEALTDKQEAFCQEYLVDLNATQAAIRAGYSEHTASEQGSRLLADVKIASRVRDLMGQRAARVELDADWVLRRLLEISDKCMQAKPAMEWDADDKCMVQKTDATGELLYEFDAGGANKATELIGKHLGFFEKNNSQKRPRVTMRIGGRAANGGGN